MKLVGHTAPSRQLRPGRTARTRWVLLLLAASLLALFWARVLLGDFTVTIVDFVKILAGEQIPGATFIVMESKLPRAVLALLVGFAFGVGGAVFQGVLRNPLASPDVIGISTGASAGAVIAISLFGLADGAVQLAAVSGALATAVLVRLAAGGTSGGQLVLGGIGASAGLLAVIQHVFIRADDWDVQALLRWVTGSVSSADWPTIGLLVGAMGVLLVPIVVLAPALEALELGDDTAAGLGVGSGQRDLLLVTATALVAVAVAASGPVAFVAFLAGPLSRLLLRRRPNLIAAGLVGACLVVAGDYVGAYLLGSANLPVGVVTGVLGAPFLLWLMASGRTARRV